MLFVLLFALDAGKATGLSKVKYGRLATSVGQWLYTSYVSSGLAVWCAFVCKSNQAYCVDGFVPTSYGQKLCPRPDLTLDGGRQFGW